MPSLPWGHLLLQILKEHCRNWVQTGQVALLHMIMTRKQLWFKMREVRIVLCTFVLSVYMPMGFHFRC